MGAQVKGKLGKSQPQSRVTFTWDIESPDDDADRSRRLCAVALEASNAATVGCTTYHYTGDKGVAGGLLLTGAHLYDCLLCPIVDVFPKQLC